MDVQHVLSWGPVNGRGELLDAFPTGSMGFHARARSEPEVRVAALFSFPAIVRLFMCTLDFGASFLVIMSLSLLS